MNKTPDSPSSFINNLGGKIGISVFFLQTLTVKYSTLNIN